MYPQRADYYYSHENRKSALQNKKSMLSNFKIVSWINKIHINNDMFQVSCQNIEKFSRNLYFQVGGLHVRVRVLILVFAPKNQYSGSMEKSLFQMSVENQYFMIPASVPARK